MVTPLLSLITAPILSSKESTSVLREFLTVLAHSSTTLPLTVCTIQLEFVELILEFHLLFLIIPQVFCGVEVQWFCRPVNVSQCCIMFTEQATHRFGPIYSFTSKTWKCLCFALVGREAQKMATSESTSTEVLVLCKITSVLPIDIVQ